jgi:hypothetical protein
MAGTITAVSSVAVTLDVDATLGSGTYTSWNLVISGEPGPAGSTGLTGPAGGNAYTTTTASYTQPAESGTVSVSVSSTAWMVAGQFVFVETGGYYTVSSITSATVVELLNLNYTGNAAPASTVTSPKGVSPGGRRGSFGAAGAGEFRVYTFPLYAITNPTVQCLNNTVGWANARVGTGTLTTNSTIRVGDFSGSLTNTTVYQTVLETLTGDLLAGLTPIWAELGLCVSAKSITAGTDFDVHVRSFDHGGTCDTTDFRSGASAPDPLMFLQNTADLGPFGANDPNILNCRTGFETGINTTAGGYTRMILMSSHQIGNVAPDASDNRYISLNNPTRGSTNSFLKVYARP